LISWLIGNVHAPWLDGWTDRGDRRLAQMLLFTNATLAGRFVLGKRQDLWERRGRGRSQRYA